MTQSSNSAQNIKLEDVRADLEKCLTQTHLGRLLGQIDTCYDTRNVLEAVVQILGGKLMSDRTLHMVLNKKQSIKKIKTWDRCPLNCARINKIRNWMEFRHETFGLDRSRDKNDKLLNALRNWCLGIMHNSTNRTAKRRSKLISGYSEIHQLTELKIESNSSTCIEEEKDMKRAMDQIQEKQLSSTSPILDNLDLPSPIPIINAMEEKANQTTDDRVYELTQENVTRLVNATNQLKRLNAHIDASFIELCNSQETIELAKSEMATMANNDQNGWNQRRKQILAEIESEQEKTMKQLRDETKLFIL